MMSKSYIIQGDFHGRSNENKLQVNMNLFKLAINGNSSKFV